MAVITSADLVAFVLHNELLEKEQADELVGELAACFPDPHELARELVARGWLTAYQVQQLAEGAGQGLVVGNYLLLERLGSGGMGEVYKARHRQLGRVVALKILRRERLAQPEAVARFRREIQAAARLSHPNVVHAYDAGEAGGHLFYTMEFVAGIDLFRLVKHSGPLPVRLACDFTRQAALGLQHAHEHGLVHRDIKPSNLLRTADGVVKILDMGLARLQDFAKPRSATELTHDKILGTPEYMAPEQAKDSHRVDIRSDLYSLGCTFYFLLTAQVPFPQGKTALDKIVQHQKAEPVPIESVRPEVAAGVRAILRRLITRDIEARFQTPAELAAALEPFARKERTAYDRSRPPPTTEEPRSVRRGSEPRPPVSRASLRPALVAAAAVTAAVGLLALIVWAVTPGKRSGAAGPASPPPAAASR